MDYNQLALKLHEENNEFLMEPADTSWTSPVDRGEHEVGELFRREDDGQLSGSTHRRIQILRRRRTADKTDTVRHDRRRGRARGGSSGQ